MAKWEYRIQKFQIQNPGKAEDALNEWGNEGFEIVFATAKDANVIAILARESSGPVSEPKRPVGRPSKSRVNGPSAAE